MLMVENRSNTANFQSYFKLQGDEALMEKEYEDYLMDMVAEDKLLSASCKHLFSTYHLGGNELGRTWRVWCSRFPRAMTQKARSWGPVGALYESLL